MKAPSLPILIALAAPVASAQEEPLPVGSLRVEGNRRTEDNVILRAADLRPGDPFGPETAGAVRQRVLNLRLFQEVAVDPQPNGAQVDVAIRVKERWTLLPIPFVGASSRGVRGGAFVVESNLFGWNKLLALGGTFGGEGPSAFAYYRDPGVAGTRFLMKGQVRYGDLRREQFDGSEQIYAYRDQRLDASLSGGYQVTPWLALFLGWYAAFAAARTEDQFMPPPDTGPLHGWTADVELRAQDFHLYYNEGLAARFSYRHALDALGAQRDVLETSGFIQYAFTLLADQSTSLTLQGALNDGDPILDAVLLGGIPGTRGFERLGLWAERSGSLTLEHQIPVLRFKWGIWTLNAFAEVGGVTWRGQDEAFFTPGAGFRLYLLGVALPAVGVDVAYSVDHRRTLAIFNLGLSL